MSDYRIIVYNVELPELEVAIQKAMAAYTERFEDEPRTLTVQPSMRGEAVKIIDAQELQLKIDRFPASPGTIQIGR